MSVYKNYQSISDNYKVITENIRRAAEKSGRSAEAVRILAVTKTVDIAQINEAVACGIDLLGESRAQEFLLRKDAYQGKVEVHFIGGLQTNKVRAIINDINMFQSVDNGRLACEIDKLTRAKDRFKDILIQVNIAREDTKGGVDPDGIDALFERLIVLPRIRMRGLMAIPPKGESERYFEKMQRLFEDLKAKYASEKRTSVDTLSMGMSEDYVQAVEYGATIVRLGTALFGSRN